MKKRILLIILTIITICITFSGCKKIHIISKQDTDFFVYIHEYEDCMIYYEPITKGIWINSNGEYTPLISADGTHITYDEYYEWYLSNKF